MHTALARKKDAPRFSPRSLKQVTSRAVLIFELDQVRCDSFERFWKVAAIQARVVQMRVGEVPINLVVSRGIDDHPNISVTASRPELLFNRIEVDRVHFRLHTSQNGVPDSDAAIIVFTCAAIA